MEKRPVMEEQEREYLMENARRVRELEETPAGTSGLYSDMTEVEKEKLIEYLMRQLDAMRAQNAGMQDELKLLRMQSAGQHRDLQSRLDRMEERAVAAEKRAEAAEKRNAELQSALAAIMDGSVVQDLQGQLAEALLQRDAALASDRLNRTELYGSKSQRMTAGTDGKADGKKHGGEDRDPLEEKADMGGRDSVDKLPEEKGDDTAEGEEDEWTAANYNKPRDYRKGMSHNRLTAAETIKVDSGTSAIPYDWTVVCDYRRQSVHTVTKVFNIDVQFLICKDGDGNFKIVHEPEGNPGKIWVRDAESVRDAIRKIQGGPVLDDGNEPIVDCISGTSASSGMMAQLVMDHYVNNIPYYRLKKYYGDHGLCLTRQTIINWLEKGGRLLEPMIGHLLDTAMERDSVVNCDETWCKVRVNGKYRKRYTWCLVNRELKIVIYCFRRGARSRKALQDILGDRLPMAMQTDGYNVYMYLDDELIDCEHLCCMAHARAKFFKAWQLFKEPDAKSMLDLIKKLYELEDHYKKLNLPPDEIKKRRNSDETNEIIIMLRSKIDAMKDGGHPPRSEKLEQALNYLDSFWQQIMAYRNNGRYSIDNNIAERFIRPLANERKNSLFYGSDRMAHISTIYHTLISTCRQMKVSVSEYFGKLFAKLVRGCTDMRSLLPMNIGLSVKLN